MRRGLRISGVLLAIGLSSCMAQRFQPVAIQSVPDRATVIVNGEAKGLTPLTVPLDTKASHEVRVEMPGYEPSTRILEASNRFEYLGPTTIMYPTLGFQETVKMTLKPLVSGPR